MVLMIDKHTYGEMSQIHDALERNAPDWPEEKIKEVRVELKDWEATLQVTYKPEVEWRGQTQYITWHVFIERAKCEGYDEVLDETREIYPPASLRYYMDNEYHQL